jgi:signal transduction histidine kinase
MGRATPVLGVGLRAASLLTRRCVIVLSVTASLALVSILLVLAATDPPLPTLNLVLRPYQVVVTALVGMAWCRRRPASRLGPLLIVTGWLAAGSALQLTRVPALMQLGIACDAAVAIGQTWALVSFPTGRVRTRLERVAIGSLVAVVGLSLALMPFNPTLRPVDYLSACGAACPPNPLHLGAPGWLPDAAGMRDLLVCVAGLVVTVPVVGVYVDRWRHGSRRTRAAIAPIVLTSLLLFPMRALLQASGVATGLDPAAFGDATWLLVIARIVFPLGFLLALLSAELLASRAAATLVERLATDRDRSRWAGTIAATLDDPTVRVGFWDGRRSAYVEADGTELAEPAAGARAWVEVVADDADAARGAGRPLAVIDADPSLLDDPELLGATAAATRVAAESGELMEDLRASRARLVDAADQERARLGRDLHDSAQQRLVAMRIRLALARERIGPPAEAVGIADLEQELDAAIGELRSVARGLYPAFLERDGVAVALRSVTRGWSVPVQVTEAPGARFPGSWESAAYFVCLEALQNVVKHAGPQAAAHVTIEHDGPRMRFTVADTGRGFDTTGTADGVGLQTMRDRMAAIGGRLSVVSAPGAGTVVMGTVGG